MFNYYVLEYVFDPGNFVNLTLEGHPRKSNNLNSVTFWREESHCKRYLNMMSDLFIKDPVEVKKFIFHTEEI